MVKLSSAVKIIIIGILVILNLIPTLQPFSVLITTVIAIILMFLPSIREMLQNTLKERRYIRENKSYEKEIRSFLQPKLSQVLKALEQISASPDRVRIYDMFVLRNFPSFDESQKDMLVLLSLCSVSETVRATESLQVYSLIQGYTNKLSIYKVDDDTKPFLTAYKHIFKSTETLKDPSELFTIVFSDQEYKDLLDEFIDNFSKDAKFAYVRQELFQSEELRETLIDLIKNGELASFGINEEAFTRMQRSLREKHKPLEAYLLLGNKITEDVKRLVKQFPHLGGFIAWSGVPGKKNVIIVGFVVKPVKYYGSAKEFIELEIAPHLKERQKEFLLTAIPLDFISSETYTIPTDASFISKNMQDCYTILNYFGSGYLDDVTFWRIITSSTIRTDELLAIIPFNIFVPDLVQSEREFIIRNYSNIKKQLNVKTLDDWSKKKPNEICYVMLSLGKPLYSEIEVEDLFGITSITKLNKHRIKNRFQDIAEQIVRNAKKFERSIH